MGVGSVELFQERYDPDHQNRPVNVLSGLP